MTKYVKHGVKRQHQIIESVLPLLERLAKIEGVKKVIPARISYPPKRGISQPVMKIQRRTKTGLKLLAHSKGAVQEIFVITEETNIENIKNIEDKIKKISGQTYKK